MTNTEPLNDGSLDDAIVATVAYSDVFDMPIELHRLELFLIGVETEPAALEQEIDTLVSDGRLARKDELVYLPGRDEVLAVHAERSRRAGQLWLEAGRWGSRLGRVPFVRGVAVTGGLACDSVADHDDIDYLIITEPRRLWLARLLCVGLVHVGLRRGVDLCPNYLVTSDHLELDERTSYTARELAQMVDIVGSEVLDEMRSKNSWLLEHLPNASLTGDRARVEDAARGAATKLIERVLSLRVFDRAERWEMNRKVAKLQSVASRRPEVGRPDESSFSADVCKGHMVGNASGIEIAWRERIERQNARR